MMNKQALIRAPQHVALRADTRAQTVLRSSADPARRFASGALIVHEGARAAPCYWLESGVVALIKTVQDGREQTIDIYLAGELIQPLSADGVTASGALQTLTPCVVSTIPAARWAHLRADSDPVRRICDDQAAALTARRGERMLRLGRGSAVMRLAYFLLEMHLRLGAGLAVAPTAFHLPMTQRQIGDVAGLCSVHVSRVFSQFSRDGVMTTRDHTDVELHDLAQLSGHAGVEIAALRRAIIPPQ